MLQTNFLENLYKMACKSCKCDKSLLKLSTIHSDGYRRETVEMDK